MRCFFARMLARRLVSGWVAAALSLGFSPAADFTTTSEAGEPYSESGYYPNEVGMGNQANFYRAPSRDWFSDPQGVQRASASVNDPIDCRTPADNIGPVYDAPTTMSCERYLASECCDDLGPLCDDCPTHGLVAFVGNDAWRGYPDSLGSSNFGLSTGVNYGTRLGAFSDLTGIGGQVGGSFGVYDWLGHQGLGNRDEAQTQGFFTYGLFRKADDLSPWSAAVVQDWMVNNNYGLTGSSPTLSQIRVQVGYALNTWNEVGFWGAWHCLDAERSTFGSPFPSDVWRSVDQYNAYWHHKWWEAGPDTWVWLGLPENDRLQGPGSLGDFIVGWLGEAPLSDRISIYGTVTYMHPSSGPGLAGASEETWNVSFGVAFYPGFNARSRTVAGRCWMPQLPVANNGTFFVDQGSRF